MSTKDFLKAKFDFEQPQKVSTVYTVLSPVNSHDFACTCLTVLLNITMAPKRFLIQILNISISPPQRAPK
jgi:hypothetical protein